VFYEKIEKALKFAKKLGVENIEIWVEHDKINELSWRENREIVNTTDFTGVGIRVIIGKKQGKFSFTGIGENMLKHGIRIAYKIAKLSKPDHFFPGLPEKYEKSNVKCLYDKKIEEMNLEKIKDIKNSIIDITKMEIPKGNIKTICSEIFLFSFNQEINEKITTLSAEARLKCGEKSFRKTFSSRTFEKFLKDVETFSKRTQLLKNFKNPKPVKSGKWDIVLLPEIAGSVFMKMLVEQLYADAVQKGKSAFEETEIAIAKENLTLIDSGIIPHRVGSRAFDGDGLKTRETILIEKGVLKSFLHNYYTAHIEEVETTGNSYRKYNSLPEVKANNIILKEGDIDIEELNNCIFVYKIIGSKLSNPTQGIMSFNIAFGFIKTDQELIPVSSGIVYDDFFDIIKNRIEICKNQEWHGNFCFPPILMKNVNIIGK